MPEPVCTYSLYSYLVRAVRSEVGRRQKLMRQSVECLPPHNFSTLSHLLAHLHLLSQLSHKTGMTSRNLALVWAPNLVRPRHETRASEESLRDIGVQARVVEFLIENYQELFIRDNEVRRLRGNLSCQDVSLAVKDEEDLLNLPPQRRRQAVHFKESNRDSQYLPKVRKNDESKMYQVSTLLCKLSSLVFFSTKTKYQKGFMKNIPSQPHTFLILV